MSCRSILGSSFQIQSDQTEIILRKSCLRFLKGKNISDQIFTCLSYVVLKHADSSYLMMMIRSRSFPFSVSLISRPCSYLTTSPHCFLFSVQSSSIGWTNYRYFPAFFFCSGPEHFSDVTWLGGCAVRLHFCHLRLETRRLIGCTLDLEAYYP